MGTPTLFALQLCAGEAVLQPELCIGAVVLIHASHHVVEMYNTQGEFGPRASSVPLRRRHLGSEMIAHRSARIRVFRR